MAGAKKGTNISSELQPKAKRPRAAFILMAVGGVFILLFALLILGVGYFLPNAVSILSSNLNITNAINVTNSIGALNYSNLTASNATLLELLSLAKNPGSVAALQSNIYESGLVGVISGVIIIAMAVMVRKSNEVKRVKMLSAVALVFSLVSFFGGAGVFFGLILALLGSILGLLYKG